MYTILSHHTPAQVAAITEINRLAAQAQTMAYEIGLAATNEIMGEARRAAKAQGKNVCDCAPDCGERIICEESGMMGHHFCGYCDIHNKARHKCLCLPDL